jgi:ATP-dependent Clp protease ATP-binding subunit ClpC
MFERFSDRCRKVMALANQQSQQLNHEYIGPEHILLGMIEEGSGTGVTILKALGVDPEQVRAKVLNVLKSGPEAVSIGKAPQTPRTKHVIEFAIIEARGHRHTHVGTEHLLVGLLRERYGLPACVLEELGVKLEDVQRLIKEMHPPAPKESDEASIFKPHELEPASERDIVTSVFGRAMTVAQEQDRHSPNTGDLLLALVLEPSSIAARVLANLGVVSDQVRAEIKRLAK